MLKYKEAIVCTNKKECYKTNCKGCFLFYKSEISCEKKGCPRWLVNIFKKAGAEKVK